MKKPSLKTRCTVIIGFSLAIFALFSIVVSYIFYSDAVNLHLNSGNELDSSKTEFFVIFSCAEVIVALIVIVLVMYLANSFIVKPLKSLADTIDHLDLDDEKITEKTLEDINVALKDLDIKSGDEIESVYRAIQKLQLKINELIIEMRGANWESEHDSMTMLSNRFRLDKRKRDVYPYVDSIYVACVNVVNMKMVNDNIGTDAGDSIISKVARELRRLQCDTIHCYRLEDDNFLIIMIGYQEEEAVGILTKWNGRVGRLNRATDNFECCLALGGSFGENDFSVDNVIERADAEMYFKKAIIKNDMINFG